MKNEIHKAVEVMKAGGVIVYPTDTIWGIGCDATNEEAVAKVYAIKERAAEKSLVTLVSSEAMLNKHVDEVPEVAWDLIDCADRPTTIVYPGAKNLAKNAVAEDGTIAIRLVTEGFVNQLVHRLNRPVISTSANKSEAPSPKSFKDITSSILDSADYVVNLPLEKSLRPSAIIKIGKHSEVEIIRK